MPVLVNGAPIGENIINVTGIVDRPMCSARRRRSAQAIPRRYAAARAGIL